MDLERLSQIGSALDTRFRKKKASGKTKTPRKAAFGSLLEEAVDESQSTAPVSTHGWPALDGSETLEGLLDDVHEAGEALKKDPVFGPMGAYKKAVQHFLRYVLEMGIETEETLGIRNPRTFQQKKYVVIRVVDERLENLAAHVLKNQADQFEILRRIDEIHGMLVDLMS
ncbi:MAG: YaaR family protein [Spirochaetales bacterium]|nr:YaaR family protein [Spirochaetales bacterium]